MNALWNSALGLLVVTGALLGLSLPFGKIGTEAGVPPVVWAFVISAGGGGAILAAMLLGGQRVRLTARKLRYFFVTATITYALPNLLLFSVMPHVGAGYAGIMYTLSPIVTLVLSILFGVRKPTCSACSALASASSARLW
jgi:drug/metabolite transporter (DMT)-like permease